MLLFKNINFNLTQIEFESLQNYIDNIDENYWLKEYRYSVFSKNIPIPVLQENLMIMLDTNDLLKLRELLNYKNSSLQLISFAEIDHTFMLN